MLSMYSRHVASAPEAFRRQGLASGPTSLPGHGSTTSKTSKRSTRASLAPMSASAAACTVFSWRSYRRPGRVFRRYAERHGEPVLPSQYCAEEISRTCQQHPQRVISRCLQVASRCGGWIFAVMQETASSAEEDAQRASELRRALVDLGPSFVKVGQLLSSRVDLLPPGPRLRGKPNHQPHAQKT